LAYQPPANGTFLSEQTRHQQPANSTFLSEETSVSHQPNEQAESKIWRSFFDELSSDSDARATLSPPFSGKERE
jgi:hypothetical protein